MVNAKMIARTKQQESKTHLKRPIFSPYLFDTSDTKSSYTCKGKYVRKKHATPSAVDIIPKNSIIQRKYISSNGSAPSIKIHISST